jgi:hypothetical protein
MALLIVLERLSPAERVVSVLDVFDYSFAQLAPMVDRSPAACRQLASRARRRISIESAAPKNTVDPLEMRRVAERFVAAIVGGELQQLLEVLDPQVVGWVDTGGTAAAQPQPTVGRDQVAARAIRFFRPATGATQPRLAARRCLLRCRDAGADLHNEQRTRVIIKYDAGHIYNAAPIFNSDGTVTKVAKFSGLNALTQAINGPVLELGSGEIQLTEIFGSSSNLLPFSVVALAGPNPNLTGAPDCSVVGPYLAGG